jgi:hypothetical protein
LSPYPNESKDGFENGLSATSLQVTIAKHTQLTRLISQESSKKGSGLDTPDSSMDQLITVKYGVQVFNKVV